MSYVDSEVLRYDADKEAWLPGQEWPQAVNRARLFDKANPGFQSMRNLGIAVGGFIQTTDVHAGTFHLFSEAAQPPMDGSEYSNFVNGIVNAQNLLLRTEVSRESVNV